MLFSKVLTSIALSSLFIMCLPHSDAQGLDVPSGHQPNFSPPQAALATPLDSTAATLPCAKGNPPALCEYARLYWQLFANCGLSLAPSKVLGFLPLGGTKRVPLPTDICEHYMDSPCYLVQAQPEASDSDLVDLSLPQIFATPIPAEDGKKGVAGLANALAPSDLPPLPMPNISLGGLLSDRRSLFEDRRNCNDSRAAALAANAATMAKGQYSNSITSNVTLTFADGYFRSPLRLLESDANSQAALYWNLLAWYRDLAPRDRSSTYYYVAAIRIAAGELEIHSQNATDTQGAAQGGVGFGILAASVSGTASSNAQDLLHVHQYVVPNSQDAVQDLDVEELPSYSVVRTLAQGIVPLGSLVYDSGSDRASAKFRVLGMPVGLCLSPLWSLASGTPAGTSLDATYLAPSPGLPQGGCDFGVTTSPDGAVEAQGEWRVKLDGLREFTLVLAVGNGWRGFAVTTQEDSAHPTRFTIAGGGAHNLNVEVRPSVSFRTQGCVANAAFQPVNKTDLDAGVVVVVDVTVGGNMCLKQVSAIEVHLLDGATVHAKLPQ